MMENMLERETNSNLCDVSNRSLTVGICIRPSSVIDLINMQITRFTVVF